MRGAHAIKLFHEQTRNKRRVLRLPPWNHAEQARLHRQIQNRNAENGKKNAPRNIFLRLANFAPEMADIVIAPVTVDGIDHRRSQPCKPQRRKMKRARRKIESQLRIEMAEAAQISQSIVPTTPAHNNMEIFPMVVILR